MAEALPEPLDFYEAWIEADKYEALQNQPVEPAATEQEPCEAAAETGEAAAADIARHGDPYEKLFEDGDPEDLDVKEEKEDDLSDYQLSKKMRVAMDGHFKIMLPRPKIRGRPKEETPSNPTEPMKEEAQSTEGTKVELGSDSATEPSSPTAVPQEEINKLLKEGYERYWRKANAWRDRCQALRAGGSPGTSSTTSGAKGAIPASKPIPRGPA